MISEFSNRTGLRRRITTVLAAAAIVVFGQAAWAADEMHEVSWAYQEPNQVASFILYISPKDGSVVLSRQVNVGVPDSQNLGVFELFSAIVEVGTHEFVAVAALGHNGLLSPLSAWSRPQPSAPGQPVVVGP